MERWIEGTVVENKRWNERLCSLRVKADAPSFEAGQFLRLGLEVNGDFIARPYSLVNPPNSDFSEFYFNCVPEGPLSPKLHSLEAGDKVWLSQMVAGFLTLSATPQGERLWMLATGTALGPFLSILQAGEVWHRFKTVVLVHGVRSVDELTYLDLIDDVKAGYGDRFIPVASITREKVNCAISERISDAIHSGSLEQKTGLTLENELDRIMICGNPGMVQGCLEALEEKGFRRHRRREPGHIVMEIYK
ncbi:ferredoxin--NADP reductase [Porticoccaceae bacterium LTM1]|nr:ferredoxin--NADP reductase [Porticoccaceae bacterium LTM1]